MQVICASIQNTAGDHLWYGMEASLTLLQARMNAIVQNRKTALTLFMIHDPNKSSIQSVNGDGVDGIGLEKVTH